MIVKPNKRQVTQEGYENKYLVKEYYHNVFNIQKLYGLAGLKIPYGQTNIENIIQDKLKTKFKVEGEHKFRCIQNCLFTTKEDKVFLDFLYIVFDVEVVNILGETKGFFWHTKEEIKSLPKLSYVLDDYVVNNHQLAFSEKVVRVVD